MIDDLFSFFLGPVLDILWSMDRRCISCSADCTIAVNELDRSNPCQEYQHDVKDIKKERFLTRVFYII